MGKKTTPETLRAKANALRNVGNTLYDEADEVRADGSTKANTLRRKASTQWKYRNDAKKPATVKKYEKAARALEREADKIESAAHRKANRLEARGQRKLDQSYALDNDADDMLHAQQIDAEDDYDLEDDGFGIVDDDDDFGGGCGFCGGDGPEDEDEF